MTDSQTVGLFVHGFRSSSAYTKATCFREHAQKSGYHWLDFDLPCHGISEGEFHSFRVSDALEALLGAIRSLQGKPVVLVGSSMGGWLSMLAARALGNESRAIKGAVLIAPAFDFVEYYFQQGMNVDLTSWKINGTMSFQDAYEDLEYRLDYDLFDDGVKHSVLKSTHHFDFPIQIFHGREDEVVPLSLSEQFVRISDSSDIRLEVIEQGDHTLNAYLSQFCNAIDGFLAQ